jgi:hypothetical protein
MERDQYVRPELEELGKLADVTEDLFGLDFLDELFGRGPRKPGPRGSF